MVYVQDFNWDWGLNRFQPCLLTNVGLPPDASVACFDLRLYVWVLPKQEKRCFISDVVRLLPWCPRSSWRAWNTIFSYPGGKTSSRNSCLLSVDLRWKKHQLINTVNPRFYFIVLWDHGFHCGTLKLLEGHWWRLNGRNWLVWPRKYAHSSFSSLVQSLLPLDSLLRTYLKYLVSIIGSTSFLAGAFKLHSCLSMIYLKVGASCCALLQSLDVNLYACSCWSEISCWSNGGNDAWESESDMLSTNGQLSTPREKDKAFIISGRMNFSLSGSGQHKSLSASMFFLPLLYFMTKS